MNYKTIIFDFYNTLVDEYTDEHSDAAWIAFTSHLEKYSLHFEYQSLRERYFKMDEELRRKDKKYQYPEIDITRILDQFFQEQGKHFSNEELSVIGYDLRCCTRDFIHVYKGVYELLMTLRTLGCQIILLSNAQHCFTMPEIELMKLTTYFDKIYLSSDYGCMKPESDFFNLIFQNNNVPKSECLMIGDNLFADIGGADRIGIDSLFLDNQGDQEIPAGSRCIGILRSNRRDGILKYIRGEN